MQYSTYYHYTPHERRLPPSFLDEIQGSTQPSSGVSTDASTRRLGEHNTLYSDDEIEAIMAYHRKKRAEVEAKKAAHRAKRRAQIGAFVRAEFVRKFVGKVAGVKPIEDGVVKHQ